MILAPPRLHALSLAVLGSMTFSRTAVAATIDSPVDLIWDAPSSCPSTSAVLDQIRRSVAPSSAGSEHAVVEAHVTPGEQGRWNATLRVTTHSGMSERSLEADSCEAIASAVSLISLVTLEGTELASSTPIPASC
jgi:hypothetical protein